MLILWLTVLNSCLGPFLYVLTGFESGHHHPVMHFSWCRHSKIVSLTPDLPDPSFWWTQVYFPWDDIRNHSTCVTIFCITSHSTSTNDRANDPTAPNIHTRASMQQILELKNWLTYNTCGFYWILSICFVILSTYQTSWKTFKQAFLTDFAL